MVLRFLRSAVNCVLKAGSIPQHVAFIMDGNRRYADRTQSGNIEAGHQKGFAKLLEALEWCLELGIKYVTVYAFSIDNFKRSTHEVEALMRLFEIKLHEVLEEQQLMEHHNIQVRIPGDISLLPLPVQIAIEKVVTATAGHKGPTLNICLAYSSSQEMAQALSKDKEVPFAQRLYTKDCPPVDLLVRTSGETRLSDFMLYQSSHAHVHFTPVLWPDFSFIHLLRAITDYQRATRSRRHLYSYNNAVQEQNEQTSGLEKESLDRSPRQDEAKSAERNTQHTTAINGEGSGFERRLSWRADSASEVYSMDHNLSKLKSQYTSEDIRSDSDSFDSMEHSELEINTIGITEGRPGSTTTTGESNEPESTWQLHTEKLSEEPPGEFAGNPVSAARDIMVQMPSRRNGNAGASRRRQSAGRQKLLGDMQLDSGMFEQPVLQPLDRTTELRAKGFAGGYDSMDDDEDEANNHINGCPCCIVRFMPMHRICTDPTPAIAAIRNSPP